MQRERIRGGLYSGINNFIPLVQESIIIPTFAVGDKIALEGDSITEYEHYCTSTRVSNRQHGVWYWAARDMPALKLGVWYDATPTKKFRGSNFGVAGDALNDIDARTDPLINFAPDLVFLRGGTNTGTGNSTFEQKKASLDSILAKLEAEGIYVILSTVYPRAVTGTGFSTTISEALMAEILEFNAYIRTLASNNVYVVDPWNDMVDPQYEEGVDAEYGTPLPEMVSDGVHLSTIGAFTAAKTLRTCLNLLLPTKTFWLAGETNKFTNPGFTGTSGFPQQGITGTVPTSWVVRNVLASGQNVTGTASVADGEITLALTSDGAGSSAANTEQIHVLPLSISGLSDATWYVMAYDVEVTDNDDGLLCAARIEFRNNTTGIYSYAFDAVETDRTTDPFPTDALTMTLMTEPILYNSGNSLTTRLILEIDETAAGNVGIKVSNPRLVAVTAPSTDYPYTP